MDELILALPTVLSAILVIIAPIVIQYLKKRFPSKKTRFIFAIGLSASFGALAMLINAHPSWINALKWVLAAVGYSLSAYQVWRNLIKNGGGENK